MTPDAPHAWAAPEISVVVPLFNEAENIPELHRRLASALGALPGGVEFVLVDDASRDETPRLLAELHERDPRVTVVSLSRNFGHQAAISAGIDHACGRAVILMDGDLQDPPEVLPLFIAAWRAGNDVVYAIRGKRKENLFKRTCYALFYRLLRAISDLDIPLDSGDFCLMDRKVVAALKRLPERNRFVRGLRAFVGFKQVGLEYERAARQAGQPKYTFRALCRLALDGIIGFSSAPLRSLSYMGIFFLIASMLGALISVFQNEPVAGWWIGALIACCTGVQLVGLGIIGAYVQRIFLETKGRPTYVVGAVRSADTSSSEIPRAQERSRRRRSSVAHVSG